MERKRSALASNKGKVPAAKKGKMAEERLALNQAFLSEEVKRLLSSCWRCVGLCSCPYRIAAIHNAVLECDVMHVHIEYS